MLIPEVILYNAIKAFYTTLQQDYAAASDKNETIIHDLFAKDNNNNILQLEQINYFNNAVALFTRTQESPRQFQVNIGYNLQRAMLPSVHIILPQESHGRYNSIGMSEGEVAPEYHTDATPPYELITRTKTYAATFDLLVTSDNITDVLMIYYSLKSLFPYISDTFEILGLHNFRTTGMDVQLDPAYAPPNIFHRTLRTEFDYQSQTKIRNVRNFANAFGYTICSNIGDDNQPKNKPNNPTLTTNYTIHVSKSSTSNMSVGYARFLDAASLVEKLKVDIDLTGQPTTFTLAGTLPAGKYRVELNLMNFIQWVDIIIGDGSTFEFETDTNGDFSFNQVFDCSAASSNTLVLQLTFS